MSYDVSPHAVMYCDVATYAVAIVTLFLVAYGVWRYLHHNIKSMRRFK